MFGILLAVLAVALTFLWFFSLFGAFNCGQFMDIFSCTNYWTFTAVLGIIVLGMWVGVSALLSGLEKIGDERVVIRVEEGTIRVTKRAIGTQIGGEED